MAHNKYRVAAVITNYNMPEATDALCEHILNYADWPVTLYVVDNGSDLVKPSRYTTQRLERNVQTTGGWLAGLDAAFADGGFFAYWFLITSAEFVGDENPLAPMAEVLVNVNQAVGIHPALTNSSSADWPHLFSIGGNEPRRTWHIDNIASLWRADWFDEVGRFDPKMRYAWGIDLDMCWKARSQNRALYVHEGTRVKKVTDIAYKMERMNMTADERRALAGSEMNSVLFTKYGPDWWARVTGEFVTEEMLLPGAHRRKERSIYAKG